MYLVLAGRGASGEFEVGRPVQLHAARIKHRGDVRALPEGQRPQQSDALPLFRGEMLAHRYAIRRASALLHPM